MADGACAIMNMMTAAWSLGIGACWINALRTVQDEETIREILRSFGIPDSHMVIGIMVLGYIPDDDISQKPYRRTEVIHFVD